MKLHPVHNTYDGYFNTFSGRVVSFYLPTPEMICIEDIAHALSNLCRFGGHTSSFYSVAQHSLLVSRLAQRSGESLEVIFAALMHDATETYVQDMIKPLKNIIGQSYEQIESRFENAIRKKFNISKADMDKVKTYDKVALEIEFQNFFKNQSTSFLDLLPEGVLDCSASEIIFLSKFQQINNMLNSIGSGWDANGNRKEAL